MRQSTFCGWLLLLAFAIGGLGCGTECGNPFGVCGTPAQASFDDAGGGNLAGESQNASFENGLYGYRIEYPPEWQLTNSDLAQVKLSNAATTSPASAVVIGVSTITEDIQAIAQLQNYLAANLGEASLTPFVNDNQVEGLYNESTTTTGVEVVVYYARAKTLVRMEIKRNPPESEVNLVINKFKFLGD